MSDRHRARGLPIPAGAAALLAAVSLAAFTAGCSLPGQAAAPTPTPRPDTATLVRQLTACVRGHGDPNFPDPSIGQDGIPRWPSDTEPPSAEAQRACGSIYDRLPKPAATGAPSASELALERR